MKKYIVFLSFLALACNCKKKEHAGGNCTDQQSVYTLSSYPIGTAINMDELAGDSVYKKIAIKQFNSITPENIFKTSYIHPLPGFYDWTAPDQLLTFCQAYQKRLHGHTLIWHQQLPGWIENFEGDQNAWEALMKEHIQSIMRHFKGKVSGWDVVNEAFEEDGTMRNTIWRQHVGDSYIEKAFIYAHEADPAALLFYNDYDLELNPAKRKSVLDYFDNLRQRAVVIDGIGLQMHITISYSDPEQIGEALKDVSDKHFRIHLSEMDISVNPFAKAIQPSADLFKKQADLLESIVLRYKNVPAALQYGITFWGISDKNSWLRETKQDYPLLYDDNYQVKPAYCALKENL